MVSVVTSIYTVYISDQYVIVTCDYDPRRVAGRLIHIHTHTRVLIVMADTKVEALQWQRDLQDFYLSCSRRVAHRHISSYPPRNETPCRVFTCGRDYFGAVAVALLSAQHEILIASWMVSPYLWLTRPPEPPVRLDQILKFKAEQGVKIYVMLYQEVICILVYLVKKKRG